MHARASLGTLHNFRPGKREKLLEYRALPAGIPLGSGKSGRIKFFPDFSGVIPVIVAPAIPPPARNRCSIGDSTYSRFPSFHSSFPSRILDKILARLTFVHIYLYREQCNIILVISPTDNFKRADIAVSNLFSITQCHLDFFIPVFANQYTSFPILCSFNIAAAWKPPSEIPYSVDLHRVVSLLVQRVSLLVQRDTK